MHENCLILFLKYPNPGKVKTRLARSIGDQQAAFLYKNFVEYLISKLASDQYSLIIYFDPSVNEREIKQWLGESIRCYPQSGDDLGQRMKHAFNSCFYAGAKKVIIAGTDSPQLEKGRILDAFSYLQQHDAVIGPTFDGGYYLIALKRMADGLFSGIEWSSSRVYEQTLERFSKNALMYKSLNEMLDIDDVDDLNQLKRKLPDLYARLKVE